MEAKDYCRTVEVELYSWKAKMYDMVRKVDKLRGSVSIRAPSLSMSIPGACATGKSPSWHPIKNASAKRLALRRSRT